MVSASFKKTGRGSLAAWYKRLDEIPKAVRREMASAVETNAQEFRRALENVAPIDQGELLLSIHAYPVAMRSGMRWRVVEGVGTGPLKGQNKHVYYPYFIEFGTEHHAAQPHFFPTYRFNRTRYRSRLSRAVRKGAKATVSHA